MTTGLRQYLCPRGHRHGFTLIELVAVMTLLTILLAVAAPQLAGFFRGRELEEETRRMAALTRFARSEAIARSERMRLWLAPDRKEYGLEGQGPEREGKRPPITYSLNERLGIELPAETPLSEEGEAELTFWPDGMLDDASPTEFTLLENDTPARRFVLSANRMEYTAEVVSDEAP